MAGNVSKARGDVTRIDQSVHQHFVVKDVKNFPVLNERSKNALQYTECKANCYMDTSSFIESDEFDCYCFDVTEGKTYLVTGSCCEAYGAGLWAIADKDGNILFWNSTTGIGGIKQVTDEEITVIEDGVSLYVNCAKGHECSVYEAVQRFEVTKDVLEPKLRGATLASVATIAERDAISEAVRFEGLEVFVEETKIKYRLEGGITNDCWVDKDTIPDGAIGEKELNEDVWKAYKKIGVQNLIDFQEYELSKFYLDNYGNIRAASDARMVVMPISGAHTFTVKKEIATIMKVGTITTEPAVGVKTTSFAYHAVASAEPLTVTSGENDKYLCIQLFADADSDDVKDEDMLVTNLSISGSYGETVFEILKKNRAKYENMEKDMENISKDVRSAHKKIGVQNLIDFQEYELSKFYLDNYGNIRAASDARMVVMPISGAHTFTVKKEIATIMKVGTITTEPAVGVKATSFAYHAVASAEPLTVTSGENDKYLCIQLFADADSDDVKDEDMLVSSLMVTSETFGSDVFEKLLKHSEQFKTTDEKMKAQEAILEKHEEALIFKSNVNLSEYDIRVGTVNTNNGAFSESATNRIVNNELIPVKSGEKATISGDYQFNVFLFDEEGNYVSKGTYGYTSYTFTADGFVRFSFGLTGVTDTTAYLEDIVEKFIFEKKAPISDAIKAVEEKVEEVKKEVYEIGEQVPQTAPSRNHIFNFPYNLDALYLSEYTEFEDLRDYTPAQMHEKFQALCDSATGYASYEHLGDDADGNALYKYVLEPNTPYINCKRNESTGRTFDGEKIDTPTILIISGIHGSEHSDDYALYHLFKNLLTNRNSALSFIFRSVRLVVVPCSCPSGLIANTYSNMNGVNLNRNFGVDIDAIPTESESQYIKRVIDEYPEAACLIDMHTHYTYDVMSWNYTDDEVFKYIATRTMSDLTFAWMDKYPDVEFDTVNGESDPFIKTWVYSAPNVDTTCSTYAYKVHGIPAGTIETRRALPITGSEVRHGTDAVAFTYDALVNFIVAFCRTLQQTGNGADYILTDEAKAYIDEAILNGEW